MTCFCGCTTHTTDTTHAAYGYDRHICTRCRLSWWTPTTARDPDDHHTDAPELPRRAPPR